MCDGQEPNLDATRAREIADEIMASISVVADDREWMRGQLTRSATEGLSEAAQLRVEREAAVEALQVVRQLCKDGHGDDLIAEVADAALSPTPEAETT